MGAFVSITGMAFSQTDSLPVYKQFPTVPAFKLMKADSSFIQLQDLTKKKASVIIIFSPTCGHCQHQAEAITSHIKDLKDVNFVFSTSYPVDEMKQYISSYGLDRFPNITVVHDNLPIMGTFYKVESFPGVFVYDKKGKLVANFDTNVTADTILKKLKG